GKRNATGDSETEVGRRVNWQSPIGLRRRDPQRVLAVQNGGVVFTLLDRSVIFLDRLHQAFAVDTQVVRQFLNSLRFGFGDLVNAILVTQQMLDLVIENLHGHAEGLLQNFAAVLGIRIVAEVGSFINKTFAFSIDDKPKGIRVFLIELSNAAVTRG